MTTAGRYASRSHRAGPPRHLARRRTLIAVCAAAAVVSAAHVFAQGRKVSDRRIRMAMEFGLQQARAGVTPRDSFPHIKHHPPKAGFAVVSDPRCHLAPLRVTLDTDHSGKSLHFNFTTEVHHLEEIDEPSDVVQRAERILVQLTPKWKEQARLPRNRRARVSPDGKLRWETGLRPGESDDFWIKISRLK